MTVKEPQEEEIVVGGAVSDVADLIPAPTPGRGRRIGDAPRSTAKSDYRLRGLDLEAPAFVEVGPRQIRQSHPSRRRRRRRLMLQWLVVLVVLGLTAGALRIAVFEPYAVRTASMTPTLTPGTDVLVLRPKVLTGSPRTGDLVVFKRPAGFSCSSGVAGTSPDYLLRVIAGPGQTVWSANRRIYVNGHVLEELGWYNTAFGEVGSNPIARTTVPAGSYYVLGDNRTDPCDSRAFGPIAESSLVGKVFTTTTHDGHPSVHFF